jgi:hypothetical protein
VRLSGRDKGVERRGGMDYDPRKNLLAEKDYLFRKGFDPL